MRRFVTVTLLGLVLAGCSSRGGLATTVEASSGSASDQITAVTSVNVEERHAALVELCTKHCEKLISAIKLDPCADQQSCDLMSLRVSENIHAYSIALQGMRDRLNLTEFDSSWIVEITDALAVAEQLLTGNDCTGMTEANAASFGRCSQLTGTLREKSFEVGTKLQEMANG